MSFIGNKLVDAKTATYQSEAILVSDVTDLVLQIAGSSTAVGTIKVVGSISTDRPDFSSAQSLANQYDFIQTIDLQDGTGIDGDTGIAFTADDVRILDVNASGLRWIGVIISAYTSGQFDVEVRGYANRK